ncbi:MAG TPA: 2Fe-2S iron-sulfur cluster-binding protein, partial [Candidatus Obscuribacter sp.]|nr:2Fe-2S iron-sulfur cluster-binding protein [Candidatus Obscuribacter sp.]
MPEASTRTATLKVYRGDREKGEFKTYKVPVEAGMVVLDAIHYIQQNFDPELAVRWNCKAAKCGSCSGEVNGMPSLMCKTRMDKFRPDEEIMVQPIKTFPIIKDLVTD